MRPAVRELREVFAAQMKTKRVVGEEKDVVSF
jgi:hypothetical protein